MLPQFRFGIEHNSLGMYSGLGIVQKIESSCKERL